MKPAGNPSTGGEIPSSQVHSDALHSIPLRSIPLLSIPLLSNAIQSDEGEAIEQAEVVSQLSVKEDDGPKINRDGLISCQSLANNH